MSTAQLVQELESLGVALWEEDGKLRFRAPKGVLTDDRRAALLAAREAVIEHLRAGAVSIVARPAERYDPFPLTDVQASYLIGRRKGLAYGGVACHAYGELTVPDVDPDRLQQAWRALIRRHDMLRAVVLPEGVQQVLAEVPDYEVAVRDARHLPPEGATQALAETRAAMDHKLYDPAVWPLFEVRVSRLADECRIHISIDFLIADYVSIFVLLGELKQLYDDPAASLPPHTIGFREYLLASRAQRSDATYARDRAWWLDRLDTLPSAPELPVLDPSADHDPVRFRRWELALEADEWRALAREAAARGLTSSGVVLAAYAEVIGRWSRRQHFMLDVTLLNRPDVHPDILQIVGDFTSVELLAVDHRTPAAFGLRARQLLARLGEDLDHRRFSGVELIRELARARGSRDALMPVVFTSALGLSDIGGRMPIGEFAGGISQTPQVWIDCQAMERAGRLSINWDVREGVLPPETVDAMFAAFHVLLRRLVSDATVWEEACPIPLPAAQASRREAMNRTAVPLDAGASLCAGILEWAARDPRRPCVVSDAGVLTYGEVLARARGVAERLRQAGVAPRELVAVVADKGAGQVTAVLGILLAGAAYLPIEPADPPARRDEILADAQVTAAVCGPGVLLSPSITTIALESVEPVDGVPAAPPEGDDELAYVIYTSGSTGKPKGVMITHRAAVNTVTDINRRFGVDGRDRVLCVSSLAFDLSVYDLFGLLQVGGAMVFPSSSHRADPSHWADLVARHGVTVWNSVPGLMSMLQDFLATTPEADVHTLRLVMLSGDWVPVPLIARITRRLANAEVFALGGATEGAIWSIYFPIRELRPDSAFVPYGRPLANQTMHVLDEALRPCPDGVTGEICIGGAGVALGYFGDEMRTAARFVEGRQGEGRLYRTGDLGRYLPDGHLEILGRDDAQVKIRGHRVELGEIEAAAVMHPAVERAVALAVGPTDHRRLLLFVEPAPLTTPPPVPPVAADGEIAGAAVLDGYEPAEYLAYAAALDRAALGSMIETFTAAGLFAAGATHRVDEILSRLAAPPHYHRLVRRWLQALETHGLIVRDTGSAYRLTEPLDPAARAEAWRRVDALAPRFDAPALLDYFRRSSAHLLALIRGDRSAVDLLYPEGRADVSISLNEQSFFNRWGNAVLAAMAARAVSDLEDTRPLRVLEVGGGVGATAASVLARLPESVEYWFTDVSQYFLNAAATAFAGDRRLRLARFDLNRPFREQGFVSSSFDLIVAGDVLHAARSIPRALAQLKELLRPAGWLVFVEMTRDHGQIMTSLELLNTSEHGMQGYEDLRDARDQTFLRRPEWEQALADSGAGSVTSLPRAGDPFADIGLCAFAARYKAGYHAIASDDLTAFLRGRLPEYMVPATIVAIDAMPLTSNGKIDRRVLRTWEPARAGASTEAVVVDDQVPERLAGIWQRVLGAGANPDVDFFAAGGDSLLAAELAAKILEELPEASGVFFDDLLRRILNGPTLRELAAGLRSGDAGQADTAMPQIDADLWSPAPDMTTAGAPDGLCLLFDDRDGATHTRQLAEALAARLRVLHVQTARAEGTTVEHAVRWRARVRETGASTVHLVGSGYGTAVAIELGRQLLESGDEAPHVTISILSNGIPPDLEEAGRDLRFAGDLTLVRLGGHEVNLPFWQRCCLGDVRLIDANVDDADRLASLIAGAPV